MDAVAREDEARCLRTAKPCGPDAPTLAFKSRRSVCVDDGGKKARSPGRARSKPLKPLRREGRMTPPLPVATTLVCFLFCTRGCGCGEHPVFPAPSLFSEGDISKARTRLCRGNASRCSLKHKSDAFNSHAGVRWLRARHLRPPVATRAGRRMSCMPPSVRPRRRPERPKN